ncbi:MAG TPA: GGDEF domain-containing protein [Bradyrhizobium sp.]|uniref:GGDEF domain-containing protein n=1 Tax=Bradyrhizobium sp. TaxID=376 RepID=UPI002D7FCDEE|nr:GGDEF domain-containing protein [Bradyrhizobium sp.]HET7886092.1 GGDEF domain-containing protein [Bradyrhizobium sp.]
MSHQQGPILVVSDDKQPAFMVALGQSAAFPVIEADWAEASRAVAQLHPAIVLAAATERADARLAALADQAAGIKPYLPLLAIDPKGRVPANAIPFSKGNGGWDRLLPRLRAALRVRSLHTAVLRRQSDASAKTAIADVDPVRDATVLLVGRAGIYPALSVALGERIGLVGALSIEAAAKHLNARDIDGIVICDGFTDRVVDAFLTVLSEDPRFRHLPIVMTLAGLIPSYDLPNLEIVAGDPARVAANALPLIRQHAFEVHLSRTLRAIDADGLLDPLTGLLTSAAFDRDLATAVSQTLANGGGLSVARFVFDPANPRAKLDGARLLSRLMRQMDFGTLREDGSAIVALAETDLRTAHVIARRLFSVMRHTTYDNKGARRNEPTVSVATLMPQDSVQSLLARLDDEGRRAAS